MVSIDTHPRHSIGWIDLMSNDVDAAIEFYSGLFGWTPFTEGDHPYVIFQADGAAVAGLMAITPEMGAVPACWSTYVMVDDIDASLAAITAAGGAVVRPPFDIGNGEQIAVFSDAAGAVMCLSDGMSGAGMRTMDEPGAPCWFDCLSRDIGATISFYTSVFGWSDEMRELGPGFDYHIFSNNDQPTCGAMAMPDEAPAEVPSYWFPSIVVPDADEAAAYVAANGGQITQPPADSPFGRMFGFMDPEGAPLAAIDRSSATE